MRHLDRAALGQASEQTRQRSFAMLEHIHGERLQVPELEIINPPLWELGHVAWFQEFWCLRDGDRKLPSLMDGADRLYDSAGVGHDSRWRLPMPSMADTRVYVDAVFGAAMDRLSKADNSDESLYCHRLTMFHEMMHIEAFAYSWQTLEFPRPTALAEPPRLPAPEQVSVPAQSVMLGSSPGTGFVFDNEKWQQAVEVDAFGIGRYPVSNGEFREFVRDGGYRNERWWEAGQTDPRERGLPVYWRQRGKDFEVRRYDTWEPIHDDWPMMNLSAYEAQAYCRWAGGRLPTEAEWLAATQLDPAPLWGQVVWEWTATDFEPLPGFSADCYAEYSEPWFGDHRVVRGGSFATPPGLVDRRFRNFYKPWRNDPFIGFRICRPNG